MAGEVAREGDLLTLCPVLADADPDPCSTCSGEDRNAVMGEEMDPAVPLPLPCLLSSAAEAAAPPPDL